MLPRSGFGPIIYMFVPTVYLLPSLCSDTEKWWIVLLIGFLTSWAIETAKFVTMRGLADIDDLIKNTIRTGIGWLLYKALPRKDSKV